MTNYYHSGVALAKKKGKDIHIVETPTGIGDLLPVIAEGSSVPRMLRQRFGDVVNVKDFGARGNGVSDDSESIKQAILCAMAKGKVLTFPMGRYNILKPIYVARSGNLHIEGAGATLTTSKDTPISVLTLSGEKIASGIDYAAEISKGAMVLNNVFGNALRSGDLIHVETTELIPTDYRTDWHNGFLVRVNRIDDEGVHISDPFPYRVQAKKSFGVTVGNLLSAHEVMLPSVDGRWEDLRLFVKFGEKTLHICEWDNTTKTATFVEDISDVLTAGDSISLESKNTCTIYRPITVTINALNFYKNPQTNAIEGTGGYRGMDIQFGNECEVRNSSIKNFSETNFRFVMCYKSRAENNNFEGGNRIYSPGPYKADGIGYGLCVCGGGYHVIKNNIFKSNRGAVSSSHSGCRSVDCVVEGNIFFAPEGLSYAGSQISPETPIDLATSLKSYAFGGHGDALRWVYRDNTIIDYPVGSSIRDEESSFIGNVFLGKVFRALKFERVYGATVIGNIYKPSTDFNHSRMIRFTLGEYRPGKRILVENNVSEGAFGPLIDIGLSDDANKNILTDFTCRGNKAYVRQGGLEPMCGGIGANFEKTDFKIASDCVFEANSIQYAEDVSLDKRVGFLGIGYSWDIDEGTCLKVEKDTFLVNVASSGGKAVIPRVSRAPGVSVIDVYAPYAGNFFGMSGIMYQNGYDLNPATKGFTDPSSGTSDKYGRVKVASSEDSIEPGKNSVWLYNTGNRSEIGICNTMSTPQYLLVHIKDAGGS